MADSCESLMLRVLDQAGDGHSVPLDRLVSQNVTETVTQGSLHGDGPRFGLTLYLALGRF